MNHVLYIIPILLAITIPTAFAQTDFNQNNDGTSSQFESIINDSTFESVTTIDKTSTTILNEDGTYTWTPHAPYVLDDSNNWVPYIVEETQNIIQIKVSDGKLIFDKQAGAVTIFKDDKTIIGSDSYVVRTALLNSDEWTNLNVNDSDVTTTIEELEDKVIVSFIRENNEGIFTTEYVINGSHIKTTVYFTNYIYENNKFAFTQTINLPDSIISINEQEIDLNNYVNQSFPREVLEQNEDLIMQIKDFYYFSGLGFENLWSVNISTPTKVSLDYANVDQTQTGINETVELDPTFSWTTNQQSGYMRSQVPYTGYTGIDCSPSGITANGYINLYTPTSANTSPSNYAINMCYRSGMDYDITSIPDTARIQDVDLSVDVTSISGGGRAVEFTQMSNSMEYYRVNTDYLGAYNDAGGNAYVSNTGIGTSVSNNNLIDLGSVADSDLETDLINGAGRSGADVFTVGVKLQNEDRNNHIAVNFNTWSLFDAIQLQVTYALLPDAPAAPTVTNVGLTNTVNWVQPNNNGWVIDHYQVYRNGVWQGNVQGATNTSYTDTNVSYATSYYYQIKAHNFGYGSFSPNSNTVTPSTIPDAVNDLTLSQTVGDQINITWSAPNDQGSAITGYTLSQGNFGTVTVSGSTNSHVWNVPTNLRGTWQDMNIIATNANGNSANGWGPHHLVWDIPNTPSAPTATYVSNTSNNLTWSAPPDGGAVIDSYGIYRDGTYLGSLNALTFTDTTVTPGSTVSYTINAHNAVGWSSQSTASNSIFNGAPWNIPTNLSATVSNANTTPLLINLSWDASTQGNGSGILTGYELFKDGVSIGTLGTVTSTTHQLTAPGTFNFTIKSLSTHGDSNPSTAVSVITPTVPSAINDLSGVVISDSQINLSWTAPSDGGSNIIDYDILRDGVTITTITNNSYQDTGLTPNTAYIYEVFSRNNVGFSSISNQITETTYQSVGGSIAVTTSTQGATTEFSFAPNNISGTPTPTFNLFTLMEGTNVIASGITSPYYLAHNDDVSKTYSLTSSDLSHWNSPTITGTITAQSDYAPSWNTQNVSYNYTRNSGVMDLTVNKDNSQNTWNTVCSYKTTTEVIDGDPGISSTHNGVWFISESQSINDADTVYVSCVDGSDQLFSFTSFGPNRLAGGIAQLDNVFGDMTGTPVALIFVLLVAGLFTGRSAPTGILLVLALVGVLGFIGMLTIDEAVWGFLLLAGVLGIFIGKRFL